MQQTLILSTEIGEIRHTKRGWKSHLDRSDRVLTLLHVQRCHFHCVNRLIVSTQKPPIRKICIIHRAPTTSLHRAISITHNLELSHLQRQQWVIPVTTSMRSPFPALSIKWKRRISQVSDVLRVATCTSQERKFVRFARTTSSFHAFRGTKLCSFFTIALNVAGAGFAVLIHDLQVLL